VLAACDVTFAMLSDPAAAEAVVFGPGGVLEGVTAGKGYVDMSTGAYKHTRIAHERAHATRARPRCVQPNSVACVGVGARKEAKGAHCSERTRSADMRGLVAPLVSRMLARSAPVDADTSRKIGDAIAAKGGRFLEAPVSGSKKPAIGALLCAAPRSLARTRNAHMPRPVCHTPFVS
jgi:hypothetical protein